MIRTLLILVCLAFAATCSADLTNDQQASVMELRSAYSRMGSCFAFSQNHAITAAHVVEGHNEIYAVYKGQLYKTSVLAVYEQWDIAVIGLPCLVTSPLEIQPQMSVGTQVVIYGFPSGAGFSASYGSVTELNSPLLNMFSWRWAASCTALVRGGYSGGPVVDRQTNKVIGVLTNRQNGMFARNTGGIFTRSDQIYRLW